MDKDDVIAILNDLIQITEDSHEGYRRSAEDATDPELKGLFNDLSAQRGAVVRDLQKMVAGQGGEPQSGGTVLGGAHRFFADVKSAVLGRDSTAILKQAERGENEAVRRFEAALEKELPDPIREAIRGHLERIRSDCNRMTTVKNMST